MVHRLLFTTSSAKQIDTTHAGGAREEGEGNVMTKRKEKSERKERSSRFDACLQLCLQHETDRKHVASGASLVWSVN